jgi:YD repeat-containing protein
MTEPDGGVTNYVYDTDGEQTQVTGPTGAVSSATYDYLGRRLTSTDVERYPCAAALQPGGTCPGVTTPAPYTTDYNYFPDTTGNGPWLASVSTPAGVEISYAYDAAGETASMTDGAQNKTSYGYDPAGDLTQTSNPDGTASASSYDQAGRLVGQSDLSATGTVLRSNGSAYDSDGNMVSSTDYQGDNTTFTYNADDWLTAETQPVTATSGITASFGYDANGNRTLFTDGNANNWWTTYNTWNLPEKQIEPTTPAHNTVGTGTFTTSYDADGNPVTLAEPGSVTQASTYNNMGELSGQTATGAAVATPSRSFTYDLAGNMTSAATSAAGSTAATSESFAYDDRGLPLTSSGSAGSSALTYNGDGQVASVADGAGTTSYTYDDAGRLATLADPLIATTATYSYNPMSQVSAISYGTGNDTRSLGYDPLHRLTSDTLATSAGQQVASINYGYDPNDNLTSKTTTGFAGASARPWHAGKRHERGRYSDLQVRRLQPGSEPGRPDRRL